MHRNRGLSIVALIACGAAFPALGASDRWERPFPGPSGQSLVEVWETETTPNDGAAPRLLNLGDLELETLPPLAPAPSLIGGAVVDPADWPASFASSQGNSGCTATLYGPQMLLLAAHCVGDGRTSVIKIGTASYTGTCAHHPEYRRDATADWAACKMSAAVDVAHYERILTDAAKVVVGGDLMLCGMGCTTPGGSDGAYGTFRCGLAKVQNLPSRDYDVVTKGGAALCYGDSGGTAYLVDGAKRFGAGINSRGDIRTTSYLPALWKAVPWLTTWSATAGVKVCGIHADAVKCQGAASEPELPALPAWCAAELDAVHACLYGTPRRLAVDHPDECRKSYANLFSCEESAERAE